MAFISKKIYCIVFCFLSYFRERSFLSKNAHLCLPKSKLYTAFNYALNQKEGFMNYLQDGNCSISNNLAENSIRPFTVERRNWLFSASPKGADASAAVLQHY